MIQSIKTLHNEAGRMDADGKEYFITLPFWTENICIFNNMISFGSSAYASNAAGNWCNDMKTRRVDGNADILSHSGP